MCNKKSALAWQILNEVGIDQERNQTMQNLKKTVEKNELNYGTTISRNYLVNQQFPHQTMKYSDYTK